MSDFKQRIKSVELSALPDIARQLLRRLSGGESAAGVQAQQFNEPEMEGVKRAEYDFAQAELTDERRIFFQGSEGGFEPWQFPGQGTKTGEERVFMGDENSSERESFRFLDMALSGERAEPGVTEEAAVRGGYAMQGRSFRGDYAADRYRDMEEISEFFRRDGRRYDSGFKQY